MDRVVVVEGVAYVFFELGEEAGGYEGSGGGVDAGFALRWRVSWLSMVESGEWYTWPPEKPTATTPSSLPFVKNLG